MMGLTFRKKYQVAVVDSDPGFVQRVAKTLREWYSNRVVVQAYTNHNEMFVDLNLAKSKNKPFDVAIMKPEELPTSMILRRAMPTLKVVMCEDEKSILQQTAALLA